MDSCTCFLFCFKAKMKLISLSHIVWSEKGFLSVSSHTNIVLWNLWLSNAFSGNYKVLDLVSLYKTKIHIHQVQNRCFKFVFFDVQMMKINCDTAQEYYLQQAIKDKMQGFSFSHPKCSATVLLQLAVELQHLKEEFYNVGKWTMLCTLAFFIV